MRRFEMRAGKSSKFWEVEVSGTNVVVRFGRIGTEGQTKSKRAASADAARADADKLVREKVAKGYVAIGAKPANPAKVAKVAKAAKVTKPPKRFPAARIAGIWKRIERWFKNNAPHLDLKLRPGAKANEIAAAEKALGIRFPDDFRASLLIHDGQDDHCDVEWIPIAQRLGSLASLVKNWKGDRGLYNEQDPDRDFERLDRDKRVRQNHLHPKHVAFAGSAFWDYDQLLFDFVPGPAGHEGQVIARDDCDLRFAVASFGQLLEDVAKRLESGKHVPVSSG